MANPFLIEARNGKNALWRYLLTILLVVVFAFGATFIVLIPFLLIEGTSDLNQFSPISFLIVSMSTFPAALVGLVLGVMLLHKRPFKSLITPYRKIAWGKLLLSGAVWFVLAAVSDLVLAQLQPGNYRWTFDPVRSLPFFALALVLVPIQTSTEELFFRGYLAQAVGLIAPGVILPVVVPSILFGLLHLSNPEVASFGLELMLPFYIGFGLLLGAITLYSHGLELALGLHAANNLYAATVVTFPSSAIPSPALFTVEEYDPQAALIVFVLQAVIYLLILFLLRRRELWRPAAVLLILALTLSACGPTAQPSAQAEPPLALEACKLSSPLYGIDVDARCGTLTVPENPEAPEGRQISLNIAVLPAVNRDAESDPLFLMAGGPGQAATEAFLPLISTLRSLNQRRDLVMVDQRGTGESNPLVCPTATPAADRLIGESSLLEEGLEELNQCLTGLDADPRYYTTEIAMRDIDQVRQALGYEQINLLGISYGTRAALVYARLYPQHVRTLVLDSVVPPGWALGESVDEDAYRALDLIFFRCEQSPDCSASFPDIDGQFAALRDRLAAEPVVVNIDHPTSGEPVDVYLDAANLFTTLRLMAYGNESASLIPLFVHLANTEDRLEPLAAQFVMLTESPEVSIANGMNLSVLCSEDVPFLPEEEPGEHDYLSQGFEELRAYCSVWPNQPIPVESFKPQPLDVPALLLSGEADPVTPPENAEQAVQFLPNSLSIVVPGTGHNVLYRGCLPRLVRDFVESGSVEGLDASCVNQIQPLPFFLSPIDPQP